MWAVCQKSLSSLLLMIVFFIFHNVSHFVNKIMFSLCMCEHYKNLFVVKSQKENWAVHTIKMQTFRIMCSFFTYCHYYFQFSDCAVFLTQWFWQIMISCTFIKLKNSDWEYFFWVADLLLFHDYFLQQTIAVINHIYS